MSEIPPRVEALARAMCAAVDLDPDKTFYHGYSYNPYPRINRSEEACVSVPAVLLSSKNWMRFAWQAHRWIFENTGGELPAS